MVKDHSDTKRENPLPPHGLLIHRQNNTYHERDREKERVRETRSEKIDIIISRGKKYAV